MSLPQTTTNAPRRPTRRFLLGLLCLYTLVSPIFADDPPPQSPPPDPKLEALRQKVAEAEALYRNFDVRYTVEVEYGTPEQREQLEKGLKVSNLPFGSDIRKQVHAIRQQEFFRIEEESRSEKHQDYAWRSQSLLIFNGRETLRKSIRIDNRIPESPTHFSVRKGLDPSFYLFEAHLLLWMASKDNAWSSIDAIPLSVFLGGHEAIISYYPRLNIWTDLKEQSTYHVSFSGPEILDGLECSKLTIRKTNFQETVSLGKITFWLAEARNFLPLKIEVFSLYNKEQQPDLIGRTTEFREIAPGVWYPSRCESAAYHKRDRDRSRSNSNPVSIQDEWEVWQRREMTIQEVSLSPAYDRSQFELSVPPQTPRQSGYSTYEEALETINRSRALLKEELAQPPTDPHEITHLAVGRRAAGSIRRFEFFEQLWDLIPKRYLTHIIVGTIITIWIMILCFRYALRRKRSVTSPTPSDHSPTAPVSK